MDAEGGARAQTGVNRLSVTEKILYGLGDHTLNLSLSALSLLYVYYLTTHVGVRPALAGAIPLVGRLVDAFTDPLMGRISDGTRWRAGRRRPFFLIGALPFGLSFALMWLDTGFESQAALFAYYASAYVLYSISATIVSVPYIAIVPEMVGDYQERTSLNSFRAALAVSGTLVAATVTRPLAEAFGGGSHGFFLAACAIGLWLVIPWAGVFAVTWERPDLPGQASIGLFAGLRDLARHRSYRILSGLYISGRIAMDLVGMMLIFFVVHCLGRPGDFEPLLGILLTTSILSLPIWLRISRGPEKRTMFIVGCMIWLGAQPLLFLATPELPRYFVFGVAFLTALGYAAVDMFPWAMLPDVIDEDEYTSGERREGLYAGSFTFLRKLGGATAVLLAGIVLDVAGFDRDRTQTASTLVAIRTLTAIGPVVFLVAAIGFAHRYTLSRAEHARIRDALRERRFGP